MDEMPGQTYTIRKSISEISGNLTCSIDDVCGRWFVINAKQVFTVLLNCHLYSTNFSIITTRFDESKNDSIIRLTFIKF